MHEYPIALICKNGHCISNHINENRSEYQPFCELCGEETIFKCPSCGVPIKGNYYENFQAEVTDRYSRPLYCHNCGKSYPWTQSAISSTYNLILEDKRISARTKEELRKALPNIVIENSETVGASLKIKKALKKLSKFGAEALKQFVLDFACELAAKLIGIR